MNTPLTGRLQLLPQPGKEDRIILAVSFAGHDCVGLGRLVDDGKSKNLDLRLHFFSLIKQDLCSYITVMPASTDIALPGCTNALKSTESK